jgi:acetate CoA/acetoacetate CoA-transferase alpha subunit
VKSKLATKEEALQNIRDGQTVMIGDLLGLAAPDEIIDGMIEKGVKDLTMIAITTGKPDEGCGKLISAKAVKKAITSHIGTNPLTREQMDAGTLEVEFVPQGTLAERIHCGGAGLGGCLTPTGIGTKVEEGKQKLTIDGREYLLEKPLHADVAIVKAWKADKYGNLTYRLNGMANNMQIAMAADFVIAEVEELVDVGELTPDEIDTPAVLVDMVYVRTGEKRPLPPSWKRMREGGKK